MSDDRTPGEVHGVQDVTCPTGHGPYRRELPASCPRCKLDLIPA